MLSYPISCAHECGLFDELYVSTDDPEIAEVALGLDASLIERSANISGDRSTVVDVCLHALDVIRRRGGDIDLFCCIYATAIFITPEDLRTSLAMMHEDPEGDVVMGVSSYDIHPVQALKQQSGYWRHMWPDYRDVQSQFYPRLVASNGTLYWARSSAFRTQKTFYVKRLKCYEMSPERVVDIDTPEDLERARQMMDARATGTTR